MYIYIFRAVQVKWYLATVEALRKKEKKRWNSVYHKNWWFFESPQISPSTPFFAFFLNANVFLFIFLDFFFESHPCYDQTQGSNARNFPFTYNFTMYP